MKSILIYSGKGGVGKTTITYALAKAAVLKKLNIVVLDMDLNTPSMHFFSNEGFEIISNGTRSGVYISKATINLFIKNAIKQINELKPDLLLIDTPPSVTDIHLSIIDKLKISNVVLVSQPTELSKSDVERTIPFWLDKKISILGVIENMVSSKSLDYTVTKLAKIKLEKELGSKQVYLNNIKLFTKVLTKLVSKKTKDVNQEITKKIIYNESITWEDIEKMYGLTYDEENGFSYSINGFELSKLKFINLKTWKKIRDAHMQLKNSNGALFGFSSKDGITEATYDKVERLVNTFENDDEGLFMIVNAPHTEVRLLTGEIGVGTLHQSEKLHNLPMVSYRTSSGDVKLFPHEVIPARQIDIDESISNGGIYSKDKRLIPSEELLNHMYLAFGDRVGIQKDFKSLRKNILKN